MKLVSALALAFLLSTAAHASKPTKLLTPGHKIAENDEKHEDDSDGDATEEKVEKADDALDDAMEKHCAKTPAEVHCPNSWGKRKVDGCYKCQKPHRHRLG